MQNTYLNKKSGTLQNKKNIITYKNLEEISTFGILKLKKKIFYYYKRSIPLTYIDIEKVLLSNNIFFVWRSYKYFIGYLCNDH